MAKNPSVKIEAEIMWAGNLVKPRTTGKYADDMYHVDLTNLDADSVKALEDLGLKVNFKDDKGKFIHCKSKLPMQVYFTDGSPVEGDEVGNGSKARAMMSYYENSYGRFPTMVKMVITDLIKYEAENSIDELLEDVEEESL